MIQYTQSAIEAVDERQTRVIVNDRADVLQCTTAFGLHVGQTDLSVAQSRSLIRPIGVLGLSTHNGDQVREAIEVGVDYIGCGPTFPSSTKDFPSFPGLPFLREVAEFLQAAGSSMPAFAIGGIDLAKVKSILETGVKRVAVSNAIWEAEQPGLAAEAFSKILSSDI